MTCPECDGRTRVLETVPREDGRRVWRRRECRSCGHRFSTNERAADLARAPSGGDGKGGG